MEQYLDYLFITTISGVEGFGEIYNDYKNGTWFIVWWFWLIWIFFRVILLTSPIWITFNLTIGKFVGNNIMKKNKNKDNINFNS